MGLVPLINNLLIKGIREPSINNEKRKDNINCLLEANGLDNFQEASTKVYGTFRKLPTRGSHWAA